MSTSHYDKLQQAFRATGIVTSSQSHDLAEIAIQTPIDMVLHCPACGLQHTDAPGSENHLDLSHWSNPPHRSHLCHGCGHIWRPADVATNGVLAVQTSGKNDSPLVNPSAALKATQLVAVALAVKP